MVALKFEFDSLGSEFRGMEWSGGGVIKRTLSRDYI
jgi:hypothetical protein